MIEDSLFILIKTLSKAEKRKFQLFSAKSDGSTSLYVQLFQAMDKIKDFDEAVILASNKNIKPSQIGNLKLHLYKNILTCLRLIEKEKLVAIEIREEMDYAKILYNKGLYKQSLKVLEKTKTLCNHHHDSILLLEILEFEKTIELRHITGNSYPKADALITETTTLVKQVKQETSLSNLCLTMYGLYLKNGLAKNTKEAEGVRHFFLAQTKGLVVEELNFNERVNFYQAHTWYFYILQNFAQYYKYAQKWQDCYRADYSDESIDIEPLLRAKHHFMNALFFVSDANRLQEEVHSFEQHFWRERLLFSVNLQSQIFIDYFSAAINRVFLMGNFDQGVKLVPLIEGGLQEYKYQLDTHKTLVFYYKIAGIYFGNDNPEKCIDYLNKILNLKIGAIRTDLQCFSRMLHLIAHFELKNFDIIDSLIKSLYRFLLKYNNDSKTIFLVMNFLKKAIRSDRDQIIPLFEQLLKSLKTAIKPPYEKRMFLYLDFVSYLESKITKQKISLVIQKKYQQGVKRF